MPQLSIILLTWNAERYIRNCLDSVLEACHSLSYEIILVDNGSTDRTREILQPYLIPENKIRLISLPENRGLSKGRNTGIRQATGEFIWLLDIDTVINSQAIHTMLEYMRSNKACGICGCRLENSQGETQESCRKYPSLRYKTYNVLSSLLSRTDALQGLKKKIDLRNTAQFYGEEKQKGEPFRVEYVIGAYQLIRRQVVEEVGLLDEKIFYGPEDADFCLRAGQAGWQVIYLPHVSFIHEYQQITHKRLLSRMSLKHFTALLYFFRKHRRI